MGQRHKMRWNCETHGCFNTKKRVKLERFHSCFPGAIGFSDLDAIVEIAGRFLVMEWKGYGVKTPTGQAIMFERLSRLGISVLVVEGDAETMQVRSVLWYIGGVIHGPRSVDFGGLLAFVSKWVAGKNQ